MDFVLYSNVSSLSVWGYGTLAVFIISLFAVLGGLFVPCMSEGFYDKTIQTMIALAVATLTGDAVLHLLPQVSNGQFIPNSDTCTPLFFIHFYFLT